MSARTRGLVGGTFVCAAVVAAVIGLWGTWGDILEVTVSLHWWQLVAAFALVLCAVSGTALVWARVLGRSGHQLSVREAAPVFFLTQVGKYLPGSVWSFGAAAVVLRRRAVPVATTVTSSLVFLVLHFAPGFVVTGAILLADRTRLDPAWGVPLIVVGLVMLIPPVLTSLAVQVDRQGRLDWSAMDSLAVAGQMLLTWSVYGLALALTVPGGVELAEVPTMVAAFILAFAAGVVVPFAPAGVGVREAVLIFLLTPLLGLDVAAAVALLSRVTHTLADVTLAVLSASRWKPVTDGRAT